MRLQNQMNRNRAPTNGNHFAAILLSMLPRVILSRMSEYIVSTAVWTLLGRACIRRAMNTIVSTVSNAAMIR